MREIKFRGYCDRDSEWRHGHYISNGSNHEILTPLPSGELYASSIDINTLGQFTGLTDKNGVDIYEGDLIEVIRNKNGALLVEFVNDYVGGWVLSHSSSNGHISLGARNRLDIEVVGNIYENPELLKAGE